MIVSASVLLPEPFGPMIAWTSPARTTRSMPLWISLWSTSTWRPLISRSGTDALLLRHGAPRKRVERHAVERPGDVLLHRHPHVMRRASRLQRAVPHRFALGRADLRLDRTLERAHDLTGGDALGLA